MSSSGRLACRYGFSRITTFENCSPAVEKQTTLILFGGQAVTRVAIVREQGAYFAFKKIKLLCVKICFLGTDQRGHPQDNPRGDRQRRNW